jgi:hypothetical protein
MTWCTILPPQNIHNVILNLCGFTGLDLNLALESHLAPVFATSNWTQASYEISVGFIASSVDLYMNGAPIRMSSDGGHTCDETQLATIFNSTKINFSVFSWTGGPLLLHNVKQSRGPFCALAMRKAKMQSMNVYGPPLKFYSSTSNFDMNETNIIGLELCFSAIELLDDTILHPQVFSSLGNFELSGCSLRRIKTDVFKKMRFLQFITFTLYNLKGFLHGNGIEWMNHLGFNASGLTRDAFKTEAGSTCNDSCQNLLNNMARRKATKKRAKRP